MNGNDQPDERRTLEDSTAERLAEIVAAAESAAKKVIDDAEVEARRQLSDADADASRLVAERIARVEEVADKLAGQAEAIKRGAEELIAELARAKQELGSETDRPSRPPEPENGSVGAEAPSRKSHLTALTFVEKPGVSPSPPTQPTQPTQPTPPAPVAGADAAPPDRAAATFVPDAPPSPAGARLLATQMAVSGSSREEIERRLRNGFEIEDTAPILDAILGPEGAK